MTHASQTVRAALFFIFGMVLIWIVYETLSESSGNSLVGYKVSASFDNLQQLKTGSDVRVAGVKVGTVSEIFLEQHRAIAILRIDPSFPIARDSHAYITSAGLLGHNYISIDPGTSPQKLTNGEVINTKAVPNINAVIEEIAVISKSIDTFLETIVKNNNGNNPLDVIQKLNVLLDQNTQSLHQTALNIERISNNLANSEGTLGKLISDESIYTQSVSTLKNIQSTTEKMSLLVNDVHQIAQDVKSGYGPLGVLFKDEQSQAHIQETLANLTAFSRKLNDKENTIGRLTSNPDLYNRAESALRKVESAVESMENSGPISAVGVVAGSLF